MDLSKAPDEEKLKLCKWYFKVGFLLLPFVWLVNCIWFFKEAFIRPAYEEQKEIRKYVIFSSIGTLIWAIIIGTWITIYQKYRTTWGEFGDEISCLLPTGYA